MNVKCSPFLVQIEQLQAVTMAKSLVHSKRTWPQWQPPVKVLGVGIASSLPSPSFKAISGKFATSIFSFWETAGLGQLVDPCALSWRQRRQGRRLGRAGIIGI